MRWRSKGAAALACLALAACAGDRPKRGFRPVSDIPVKIGAPYRAGGRVWVPADDRGYDAVGLASWYGGAHAGRPTANGERFDPVRISAAHPTLPLPSYVEVTALDSGRTILTRVNDRGPFVGGRIIDLSLGAAKALGVERRGVARVRVRRVEPAEADRIALRSGRSARARPDANRAVLASLNARLDRTGDALPESVSAIVRAPVASPPSRGRDDGAVTSSAPVAIVRAGPLRWPDDATPPSVRPSGTQRALPLSIEVATFDDPDRADGLAASLAGFGPARAVPLGSLWQVRLGPYPDERAARSALERVGKAGYHGARIVR